MEKGQKLYAFNFEIPQGEMGSTGSTGLQGPLGPTGPICAEDAIFLTFYNATKTGLLTVFSNILLPTDSKCYHVNSDEIVIQEPSNYEFTFCGKLHENASIYLKAIDEKNNSSDLFILNSSIKMMPFSKTKIFQATSKTRLHILFFTNDAYGNIDAVNLLIKKPPF